MSAVIEKALAVTCENDLSLWSDRFTRLYFGSEYCRYLIPSLDETKKMLDFCRLKNAGATFMTPPVGDRQFGALEKVLEELSRFDRDAEVVFNDWGVFSLLSSLGLEPVVGRMLSRQRKDPRIPGFVDSLPPSGARRYRECAVNDDTVMFLANHGCRRVELDPVPQGLVFDSELSGRLSFSLHGPCVFVWTTRDCPMGPDDYDADSCARKCRQGVLKLEHPGMPSMICKGNSLFYRVGQEPEQSDDCISRTVLHAEFAGSGNG